VVRDAITQDLQRTLDPGTGRNCCPRGTAQVGVIEVCQPVGGRPHLAPHATLLPRHHRVVGAEPGQHGADRVSVADDDAVHPAHLAGLGLGAHSPCGAHQRECGFGAGAGDLEG